MKKLIIRGGIVVVALIIVVLVVVFFSLNSIVKKGVETVGPSLTKVDVKLGAADLSPFSGSGTLSKLFVGNPEGYKTASAIEMGSVKVAVKIGSVMSDTIVVDEVNIQAPEITLEGGLSGNNLSKILDNLKGAPAPAADKGGKTVPAPASGTKKKFVVKDVVINGAKVNLSISGLMGGKSMTVPLPQVHLQNIGSETSPVEAGQMLEQILEPLLASVLTAAKDAIASSAKEVQQMTKGATEDASKTIKSVTDMFKKK